MWNRENHVEVVCGEDSLQSVFQPLCALKPLAFGAVAVPAGVVRDPSEPASFVTDVHMASESHCTASLNIPHCLELLRGQWMVVTVFLAVKTHDISDFKAVPHRCCCLAQSLMRFHGSDGWRFFLKAGRIEGALDPSYKVCTDMGIAGGGPAGGMAEKCLDHSGVGVCFQQVGGKTMAQGVEGYVLGDPCLFQGFLEDRIDRCGGYGLMRV